MKKLQLQDLKVKSFETTQKRRIVGGNTDPAVCGETFTARPTMCTNALMWCIQDCP